MSISIVIGTFGPSRWDDLARKVAFPSAASQGAEEVILVHHPEGTLATARNAGAAGAPSEWLLFLDADDELSEDFVGQMRGAIEAADLSSPKLFTPAVQYVRGKAWPRPIIWPRMDFKTGNWCVIGTLIQRELFLKVGGFREYGMYEDYALWAMAAEEGAEVIEVPEAVYIAHHANASRNRAPAKAEKLYWHQRIGRDVWPDHFDALSEQEDALHQLATSHLRFVR